MSNKIDKSELRIVTNDVQMISDILADVSKIKGIEKVDNGIVLAIVDKAVEHWTWYSFVKQLSDQVMERLLHAPRVPHPSNVQAERDKIKQDWLELKEELRDIARETYTRINKFDDKYDLGVYQAVLSTLNTMDGMERKHD